MHICFGKNGKELEDKCMFCNYCGRKLEAMLLNLKRAFGDKEPETVKVASHKYKYEYVSIYSESWLQ